MMNLITASPSCGFMRSILARENPGGLYDFKTEGLPAGMLFNRGSSGSLWKTQNLSKVTANLPRFQQTPTGIPSGLFVEAPATNTFRATNNAHNGWWSKWTGSTVAADTMAPDGTTSMVKFKESSGSTIDYTLYKALTTTAGYYHVMSAYVKAGGRNRVMLQLYRAGGFGDRIRAIFNLTDGTVVSSTAYGYGILNGAGIEPTNIAGVYRVWLAGRAHATITGFTAEFKLVNDSNADSYLGDGTSGLYFWGMNLVSAATQPTLTSYIENTGTGADATRSADVTSVTNLASMGFNPTAGTVVVEWVFDTLDASNVQRVFQFYSDSNNRFGLYRLNTGALGYNAAVAGVNIVSSTLSTPTADTVNKIAIAYGGGTFDCSLNGGSIVSITSAMPTVSALALGHNGYDGGGSLNGFIRKVTYYPTRLSNAQLQGLTA